MRQLVTEDQDGAGSLQVSLSTGLQGVFVHLRLNQAGRKVMATPFMQ